MFETYEDAEVFIPDVFGAGGDNHVWSYVYRRLHSIWFHIVCKPSDPESKMSPRIFFLPDIDHLKVLQTDTSMEIVEVCIVTPGQVNGSGHWKMELLDRVMAGLEPYEDEEIFAQIYVLKDGRKYIQSALETSEQDLEDVRLICQV